MRQLIVDGVKVQTCVTSPPYWGLRDYGMEGQLGMERNPTEYVNNMLEVFSLVKQLLSDDGTLWLNLGDSYAGSGNGQTRNGSADPKNKKAQGMNLSTTLPSDIGLKPKDLIGIPWKVAFALQADDWYLRQDIIWSKPNPMPESVRDRCTKSHEYIFLLSKNREYFYDHNEIKEPSLTKDDYLRNRDETRLNNTPGRTKMAGLTTNNYDMRNKRSVWEVPTQPYSGAHFATFPEKLIEPCILSGSRSGDIVFDPFFGSGTTGQVAMRYGRKWIGCELNPSYTALQNQRTAQGAFSL